MKKIVKAMIACLTLCALSRYAFAANSDIVFTSNSVIVDTFDTHICPRQKAVTEDIQWNSNWYGDPSATVKVSINDVVVVDSSGAGVYNWTTVEKGDYTLKHETIKDGRLVNTLTAQFRFIPEYTVAFNANGGTGSMSSQKHRCDSSQALSGNTFTRAGYSFDGWALSANGETLYADRESVMNLSEEHNSTVTLYAKWRLNNYSISLNGEDNVPITYGSPLPPAKIPNRTGYTFAGYYSQPNGGGVQYYSSTGSGLRNWDIDGNFELYPKWVENQYNVAFNANGGKGTMSVMELNYGSSVSLSNNAYVKLGYVFRGWAESPDGEVKYTNGQWIENLSDVDGAVINLYAVWEFDLPKKYRPFMIKNNPNDNVPTSVVNGIAYLFYEKDEHAHDVSIRINDVEVLCANEPGVWLWQPRTTGQHKIVWQSGMLAVTNTVNVLSVVGSVPPTPNPPTAKDNNITIAKTSWNCDSTGTKSTTIGTSGSGTWQASASVDWITLRKTSGSAGSAVPITVAATSEVEPRTGYVYISGHVVTVTQVGIGANLDCEEADFGKDGGEGRVTIQVDVNVEWYAQSNVDWIYVDKTSGTGETEITYTVAPFNEVMTRTGTLTIGGNTFTVTQTGCDIKLNAYEMSYDYQAHGISINVSAFADNSWDVFLGNDWISVFGNKESGRGNDEVQLVINENPSYLARTGRVTIGTEEVLIHQAGRTSNALAFNASPLVSTASAKGAYAMIAVEATSDLPWTAASRVNWITIVEGTTSDRGNGNVVYSVSPNPELTSRTGTLVVTPDGATGLGAKTHTVTQEAAAAKVSISEYECAAAGESFGVSVTVDAGVNWHVVENVSWLSVNGSTSRMGPGTVTLQASPNDSITPRECDITIAGHAFHVSQVGRKVEVESTSVVYEPVWDGDFAQIDVHPDGNIPWTATTTNEWIMIFSGDGCSDDSSGMRVMGNGDGTIEYLLDDYVGDGAPRTGTITIGDKVVYVTQRAYDLWISPVGKEVSGNAGSGTVGVAADIGAVWNAIATEPWITVTGTDRKADGSGSVTFTYAENNTGATRTGRIIIAGEEYTLTQEARRMVTIDVRCEGGKGLISGDGTFDVGKQVTLRAGARDGYVFVNWSLPDGSVRTGSSIVVTADVSKTIVANFKRVQTFVVNGESVREGTSMTFTAPDDVVDTAGTTKVVCKGTSRYPNSGRSFTVRVTEDVDFEWDMFETNYWLAVSSVTDGKVRVNGSQTSGLWVKCGDEVTLTATANSNKTFFRWTGVEDGDEVADNMLTVRMEKPRTIGAMFGTWNDTLATALDASGMTFVTGGDAAWDAAVDATAQHGVSAARSGEIAAERETWMETTVEGKGVVSFDWRVDCEKDPSGACEWDRLSVFTNGVEAARIDGKTGWQNVRLPVSGGASVVRWSFYRDDWDEAPAGCANCGWVDGVVFEKEGK